MPSAGPERGPNVELLFNRPPQGSVVTLFLNGVGATDSQITLRPETRAGVESAEPDPDGGPDIWRLRIRIGDAGPPSS